MEWISVNDQLPEKDGEYIVQYEDGRVSCELFALSTEDIFDGEIYDSDGKQVADHPCFYTYVGDVLAEIDGNLGSIKYWQPLPEPVSETKPESKYAKKLDDIFDSIEHYIIEKYNIVLDDKDEEFLEKVGMSMMMAFTGLIFEGSLVSDNMSKVVDSELEKYGY